MMNLLVIEDQPAVREIISEIITDLEVNIKVDHAINIKEAHEKISAHHWSAIVSDLNLGDGNSIELFDELQRKHFKLPPIAIVSGFLTDEYIRKAKRLNIQHIIDKPFQPHDLLQAIKEMLAIENIIKSPEKSTQNKHHRLLPEMFEMDRKLGLLFRMFDELPKKRDVSSICDSALRLAMDMVHADGGYLALYDRSNNNLIRVAMQGHDLSKTPASCKLNSTPFESLIHTDEECTESLYLDNQFQSCWPGIISSYFIGIPIYLQNTPMGVLCLTHSHKRSSIQGESKQLLGLLIKKLDTLLDNRAVHAALADSMNETLIALVRSLEARDRYTKDHSTRVSKLSVRFARKLGLDEDTVQLIRTGGLLHDIGKVGVADSILLKPGRYTDHEYAIMKAHPSIGDNILKNMDTLVKERLMVRHHHERWDGKGYPDKLGETDIPFEARIVCVADAIDAMTTHRVYRQAKPLSFCLDQLKSSSGTQFDPEVIKVAIDCLNHGQISTQAKSDNIDEGVMPIQATNGVIFEHRIQGVKNA